MKQVYSEGIVNYFDFLYNYMDVFFLMLYIIFFILKYISIMKVNKIFYSFFYYVDYCVFLNKNY